ncbi:MAG: transcriptional regulator [Armatimonadetes bacterium]|nr:transcriptional regulator [Armatimonadota bacterium]
MSKTNGFTRQEIIGAIKENGPMTADTLGDELHISPVAVRQHLAALEAEGLVRTTIERRSVGRPVHRYAISPAGDETFPRSYDDLANALLDHTADTLGTEGLTKIFDRRCDRLVAQYRYRTEEKDGAGRARELAKIQTELGYMADLAENEDGTLTLTELNCAICKVAKEHQGLCDTELRFFQEIMGKTGKVERTSHIASGDFTCAFKIKVKG